MNENPYDNADGGGRGNDRDGGGGEDDDGGVVALSQRFTFPDLL